MRLTDYWIYDCARCEYEAHPRGVIPGISRYLHPKPEEGEGVEKARSDQSESDYDYGSGLEDESRDSDSSTGNEFMDFFVQQMGNAEEMTATEIDGEVGDWLSLPTANLMNETDRLLRL